MNSNGPDFELKKARRHPKSSNNGKTGQNGSTIGIPDPKMSSVQITGT